MDSHSQGPKKNTSHGKEVLLQDTTHLIQQVTNKEVRAKTQQAIGPHEDLLTIVKRRKLQKYGHVSRSSGLAKTILQVRQVPEGSGEQWEKEKTGCEIISCAPTLVVKG